MKYDVDFSHREVLVGTVRSNEQLLYNMKTLSYYVPAKFISKYNFPIKTIALYEDFSNDFAGIRYFGEVSSYKQVRRKRIPVSMSRNNPREIYYYFEITEWKELPDFIKLRSTKSGPPFFTTQNLLENCRNSFELISVSTEEHFKLMMAINSFLYDDSNKNNSRKINEQYSLLFRDDLIVVVKNGVEIYEESVDEYKTHPKRSFSDFKTILGTDSILKRLSK